VGTRDNKDLAYVFGSLDVVSGQLVQSVVAREARPPKARADGEGKNRRLQRAFAQHLEEVARTYAPQQYPRVVLIVDGAAWHRGALITEVLERHRHLELYRLPSYSPQLNVIERLWKLLRNQVTHNRLFQTLSELTAALGRALAALQQEGQRLLTLVQSARRRQHVR
jgi:transposase